MVPASCPLRGVPHTAAGSAVTVEIDILWWPVSEAPLKEAGTEIPTSLRDFPLSLSRLTYLSFLIKAEANLSPRRYFPCAPG